MTEILISKIIQGERLRDDMGDIEGLAASIKEHGLMHPIVIDSENNLIAGGRRLAAAKHLGMKRIAVTVMEEITPKKLRILELEENIARKDLTELEKSKNLAELADLAAEVIVVEKATELTGADKPKRRGRPAKLKVVEGGEAVAEVGEEAEKVDEENNAKIGGLRQKELKEKKISEQAIADKMGIPRKTIIDAKEHVAAVADFPDLAEEPKYKAINEARARKANLSQKDVSAKLLNNRIKKCLREASELNFTDEWLNNLKDKELESHLANVEVAINSLTELKDKLKQKKAPHCSLMDLI